jgi:tRNA/rRNA methyltransferase
MRSMGLAQLVIVEPTTRRLTRKQEAIALASGAIDVLERALHVPTLPEAIADCSLAIAVSAASREFGPPAEDAEQVLQAAALEQTRQGRPIALVFGTERTGLSIEQVQQCQRVATIAGDEAYNSLNLSQAVQIMCFLARRVWMQQQPEASTGSSGSEKIAVAQAVEGLMQHLEQALIALDFLDPAQPKRLMPRLRRLLTRARLHDEEVHILRGICTAILVRCTRSSS